MKLVQILIFLSLVVSGCNLESSNAPEGTNSGSGDTGNVRDTALHGHWGMSVDERNDGNLEEVGLLAVGGDDRFVFLSDYVGLVSSVKDSIVNNDGQYIITGYICGSEFGNKCHNFEMMIVKQTTSIFTGDFTAEIDGELKTSAMKLVRDVSLDTDVSIASLQGTWYDPINSSVMTLDENGYFVGQRRSGSIFSGYLNKLGVNFFSATNASLLNHEGEAVNTEGASIYGYVNSSGELVLMGILPKSIEYPAIGAVYRR